MASADERAFVTFQRGHIRDNIILASFRADLRTLINPTTGQLFTEDEITRATSPGTRFYIEADALDLVGMANSQRAIYFVQQIDPRRANTQMLEQLHARLWLGEDPRLPATGGGGPVLATGTAGSVIPGSLTIGDPVAAIAADPNGLRYQVLEDATLDVNGQATVSLIGIDVGFDTNLAEQTIVRWSLNVPPGVDPEAQVIAGFDGGLPVETDEELAARVEARIRERPASGNAGHFRAWAQESSSSVGKVYVYPCALHSGSVVVAVLEKRRPILTDTQALEGPNARIPALATLTIVNNYLLPPTSPVVPQQVFVLVTGANPQQADMVIRLDMASGRSGGWADVLPWPTYSSQFPGLALAGVSGGGSTLTVSTNVPLPGGVASLSGSDAPQLMLFNRETSRWVKLNVTSVTDPSPGASTTRTFTIVLSTIPTLYNSVGGTRIPVVGDRLSPYTDRAAIIAEGLESYFDSLGPSEVVATTDSRFARAARQPRPSQEAPIRAGQALISYLTNALGGSAADAELTSISRNEPDLPTNITDGPNLITFGHLNIYPL